MDHATFTITKGRIGNMKRFGKTLRVDIATNWYDRKARADQTDWHQVTFIKDDADRVENYFNIGDLLTIRGRMKQVSYEKDGETHYTTALTVTEFDLLARKKEQADEQ